MELQDDEDVLMDCVGSFSVSTCVGEDMANACERDGVLPADDSADGSVMWGSEACGLFSVQAHDARCTGIQDPIASSNLEHKGCKSNAKRNLIFQARNREL